MNTDRLRRRVMGREQATQLLELVDLPHVDCVEAFLDELRSRLMPEKVAEETKQKERQFSEYANYRMKFGEHKGTKLEDIPRQYLEWYADEATEALEMISGYLESTEPDSRD